MSINRSSRFKEKFASWTSMHDRSSDYSQTNGGIFTVVSSYEIGRDVLSKTLHSGERYDRIEHRNRRGV